MAKQRYVTMDLETTGLGRSCKIVEIALWACEADDEGDVTILDKYHQRINPGIPIPAAASAVHGIFDRHVEDEPSFDQVARDIAGFMNKWKDSNEETEAPSLFFASALPSKTPLVGHNIQGYDMPILIEHFKQADVMMPVMPIVDTLKLARARWPKHPDGNKLVTCCARMGIEEGADLHGANADVEINASLYARMISGKEFEPTAASVAAKANLNETKGALDDIFGGMDLG